jgi:pyruvate,water dikinase
MKETIPADIAVEIKSAYAELSKMTKEKTPDVAVRSSATAEDLPGASFAGEHETYLNIHGEKELMLAIKKDYASLFTDRAISYRVDKGFDHFTIALCAGVQNMIRSDKACSGVMFTLDTESGFRDVVEISSSWGLGEMVVQGKVTPDEFLVFKPTLKEGKNAIIKKTIGEKAIMMIYNASTKAGQKGAKPVKEIAVPEKMRHIFTLTDAEVTKLATWGVMIEQHYTERAGKPMPMDMEWAKDGISGELYIVQARPETVQSAKKVYEMTEYKLKNPGAAKLVIDGICVGAKIVTGKARVILSPSKLSQFKPGEILVTKITDPDWEPIMKISSSIITEKGGRTSHAAIVSRELGIPAVIGAEGALGKIKTGDILTVDCSSGVTGHVFKGKLEWEEKKYNLSNVPETKTHVCLNVGNPEGAFMHSFLPNAGVGLAREEFIIASHIKVHPLALLDYAKLKDQKLKKKIDELTAGYESKTEFYVEKLAEGIAQIGAAFYPKPVIVRFSDFKTNEYSTLLGGSAYEPSEENPMLGWRGASRYYDPKFAPAFALECQAMLRVRDEMGLTNVHTMVPFCRTPEEGKKVVAKMKEFGLRQGENDLKIYVMCEIPSNILRAEEFLDIFDGFSIGSNDLSQLTLGLDRDSGIVAGISNEKDPAVKILVAEAIQACRRRGKYIGICGQAPSDYPDFLRFLIAEGIEAVSLNPDSIVPMMFEVAKQEKEMEGKGTGTK